MKKIAIISLMLLFAATSLATKEAREVTANIEVKPFTYIKITKSSKGTLGISKAKVKKGETWKESKVKKKIKKDAYIPIKIDNMTSEIPVLDDHKKPLFSLIRTGQDIYYCVALPYRIICIKRGEKKGEDEYAFVDITEVGWTPITYKDLKPVAKIKKEKLQITKDIVNMTQSDKFQELLKKPIEKEEKKQEEEAIEMHKKFRKGRA